MCRENLLLLLQHRSNFFLESEKLLFILPPHCTLHSTYILFYFFLFLLSSSLLLDLFSNPIILFWWSLLDSNCRLFNRISAVLFLFFSERSLLLVFSYFSRYFFGNLPWLRRLLTLIMLGRSYDFWRHFILWVFGLKDLFHILIFGWMRLFFFDVVGTFGFMYLFFLL